MLRYGSDCTGIDAPLVALKRVWGNCVDNVFSSDTVDSVREMVRENHNPRRLFTSIETRVEQDSVDHVDIYTAGFPCQPFSKAGKRTGFQDTRGTVFFSILRYLKSARPKVVLLENVRHLVHHDRGKTMNTIISCLHDALPNHDIQFEVLSPHTHANWPQSRNRVFIVAIEKAALRKPFTFPEPILLTRRASDLIDVSRTGDVIKTITPLQQETLKHLRTQTLLKDGVDILKEFYISDVGESKKYARATHELCPALKRSRIDYFITQLQRRLTQHESLSFMGFQPEDFPRRPVSKAKFGYMIGNSMCVTLLERLWERLFDCVVFDRESKLQPAIQATPANGLGVANMFPSTTRNE